MEWLKEKNRSKAEDNVDYYGKEEEYNYDPKAEWEAESKMELEGKDILALIISAFLVFGPLILFLVLITFWLL